MSILNLPVTNLTAKDRVSYRTVIVLNMASRGEAETSVRSVISGPLPNSLETGHLRSNTNDADQLMYLFSYYM